MFRVEELLKATRAKLINKSKIDLLKGVSTDSRTINQGDIFFALEGDNFDGHNFIKDAAAKGASAIVVSKDKNEAVRELIRTRKPSINILKVKDTIVTLGSLAKYCRGKYSIPLIAVTGSTGKTTAKDIIACVLSKGHKVLKNTGTHNNNIGVPQTIFRLDSGHDMCVLELGTNHFGEISYLGNISQPQIAVITNIGASHLEFFKNLEGVFKEKKNVIGRLKGPKIVLLNADDNFLRRIKLPPQFKLFYFGIENPCDFMASGVAVKDNKVNFLFNKRHNFCLNTLGKFNVYNALAGIACGLIFGISIKDIREALGSFQFPEKRLNRIECLGFNIIDDTYNSNPLSLRSAIESLVEFKAQGRKILVMGDMLELGKQAAELHRQMGVFISQKPIDIFVTFGKLSQSAAKTAGIKSKGRKDIFEFDSKTELIDFLKSKVNPGDVLLVKGSRRLQMEDIVSSLKDTR